MEDDLMQPAEPFHGGNGYYAGPHTYPFERGFGSENGSMYIKNVDYLIQLFDAAGFRVLPHGDLELLVDDPEEGGTLVWADITSLEVPAKTNH